MQKRRLSLLFVGALLLSIVSAPALAQLAEPEIVIVDVDTARYDDDGQLTLVVELSNVEGFDPDELVITEGGSVISDVEVDTISATSVEVGVVLAMDISGSMRGEPLDAAKAAAIDFVNEKADLDSIALVTFGSDVSVVVPFTTNGRVVTQAISELEAAGDTAFYDAMVRSAGLYGRSDLQPHIIALTDGADDGSEADLATAIAAADANDVRVFGIALESASFEGGPLQELASASNGLYLATSDTSELASLYSQIHRALNNKVTVRFSASENRATNVDFAISYGSLRDNQQVDVPGFVVAGSGVTGAESATTVTFADPEPVTVVSNLPVDEDILKVIGSVGVGLAALMVLYILFGSTGDDGQSEMSKRLAQFERNRPASPEENSNLFTRFGFLRNLTRSAEEAADKRGLLNSLNALLEQSNIALKPGEAIASSLALALISGAVVAAFTRNIILGLMMTFIVVLLAYVTIAVVGRREKAKFEEQLPDTLTLISTSLRAGYSLLQAIEAVAGEAPQPTAREYTRAIAEIRLGRQVVDALEGIAKRTQSKDFEWVVMAIEIQREVGGNLAEVLGNVAETMLQRSRLRGEVKALTAEGRISAIVLGVMPLVVLSAVRVLNPEYIEPLWSFPGVFILLAGLVSMLIGFYWSYKITDIEI